MNKLELEMQWDVFITRVTKITRELRLLKKVMLSKKRTCKTLDIGKSTFMFGA